MSTHEQDTPDLQLARVRHLASVWHTAAPNWVDLAFWSTCATGFAWCVPEFREQGLGNIAGSSGYKVPTYKGFKGVDAVAEFFGSEAQIKIFGTRGNTYDYQINSTITGLTDWELVAKRLDAYLKEHGVVAETVKKTEPTREDLLALLERAYDYMVDSGDASDPLACDIFAVLPPRLTNHEEAILNDLRARGFIVDVRIA